MSFLRINDIGLAEYATALKDLESATKIDPDDKIIKEELRKVTEELKKLRYLEKKNSFSGIFSKNPISANNRDKILEIPEKNMKNLEKVENQEKNEKNKLNPAILNYDLSYEVDPHAKVPTEINELGK